MEKNMSFSLYQCALCTLKFPSDKLRYSNDGKRLICIDCYNKIMGKDQKGTEARQNTKTKPKTKQSGDMAIKVMCIDCNYKFFYRPNPNLKLICPYCGRNKIRRYEELTAQKLINESSKDNL